MKNSKQSWRHHDADEVMYMRRCFVSDKIGLWSCVFYACENQTKQPFVVKCLELFYAQLSRASI